MHITAHFQIRSGAIGKIIASDTKRPSFLAHIKDEYSLENPLAYMCIAQYRKRPDYGKARLIHHLFLNGNQSPHEININSSVCQAIYDVVYNTGGTADPMLFEDVVSALEVNLSDSYSRWDNGAFGRRKQLGTQLFGEKPKNIHARRIKSVFNVLKVETRAWKSHVSHHQKTFQWPAEFRQTASKLQAHGFNLNCMNIRF